MSSTQGANADGEIEPVAPPSTGGVLGSSDPASLARVTAVLSMVEALLASRAEAQANAAATLRRLLARAQRAAETA